MTVVIVQFLIRYTYSYRQTNVCTVTFTRITVWRNNEMLIGLKSDHVLSQDEKTKQYITGN